MGGGGGAGVGEEQPSRLREEKVGISPLTSPDLSQKKKAVREEGGEGDKELPAARWLWRALARACTSATLATSR